LSQWQGVHCHRFCLGWKLFQGCCCCRCCSHLLHRETTASDWPQISMEQLDEMQTLPSNQLRERPTCA
jgi:hypothetical protein